ncbi:MAG: Nif3-like dinuclear metal center hexameric protein [Planctomycetaceae bacterium]|nr:Nif3-like dinuclear metal center hexameric protein [Planctomycetaceae bacterium]
MTRISELIVSLTKIAPPDLSEEWDNTGLLLGDANRAATKILTCLTLTPDVADEAIKGDYDLIVSHHPILFRPVQQITADDAQGAMILKLAMSQIAVYSPHTSYDNSSVGINRQLAEAFGLIDIKPLRGHDNSLEAGVGAGRMGSLHIARKFAEIVDATKSLFGIDVVGTVGDPDRVVSKIGIACGSAAEFLSDAMKLGCDLFVTGEARFHDCLKARELGIGMLLLGHYASERGGVEQLARLIAERHPECEVHASQVESDPLQYR